MAALSIAVSTLLLAASAGAPAQTQSPPSAPLVAEPDAIVVTGTKTTRYGLDTFIDDVTVDTNGQIAMFEEPICPASFGLPEAYNRTVEQRLREDAARVGLGAARAGCDANVVVIVSDSPGPFLAAIHGKRPDMFVGLELSQNSRYPEGEGACANVAGHRAARRGWTSPGTPAVHQWNSCRPTCLE